MSNISIIFHNNSTRIKKATVNIDGKIFIFKNDEAIELASMAASDYPTIKNKIESLMLSNT